MLSKANCMRTAVIAGGGTVDERDECVIRSAAGKEDSLIVSIFIRLKHLRRSPASLRYNVPCPQTRLAKESDRFLCERVLVEFLP